MSQYTVSDLANLCANGSDIGKLNIQDKNGQIYTIYECWRDKEGNINMILEPIVQKDHS